MIELETIKMIMILIVCLIAIITDLRYRKVFNWLTFPAMILGVLINGVDQGWLGGAYALIGLVVGGGLFFPAYILGGMGAGDIKLMAVIGAIMGWIVVINAALYTALAGGLMAIIILLVKGKLIKTLLNIACFIRSVLMPKLVIEPLSSEHPFPYAIAIAAGSGCALWLPPLISF